MRNTNLSLDELPENFLEWNETAVAFVNRCAHRINVYHFLYFFLDLEYFNYYKN